MSTINEIVVVNNQHFFTKFNQLVFVAVECNVNMSNVDFETLSKLFGRQAYEFIMQLKKVESIASLVNSIEEQLQQILNITNACLTSSNNASHNVATNNVATNNVATNNVATTNATLTNATTTNVATTNVTSVDTTSVNVASTNVVAENSVSKTAGYRVVKYFPNNFYDALGHLYKKVHNIWKCPYPTNQLAVQLGEIHKTLTDEEQLLHVAATALQTNASKYYIVKSYRSDVEAFLQLL